MYCSNLSFLYVIISLFADYLLQKEFLTIMATNNSIPPRLIEGSPLSLFGVQRITIKHNPKEKNFTVDLSTAVDNNRTPFQISIAEQQVQLKMGDNQSQYLDNADLGHSVENNIITIPYGNSIDYAARSAGRIAKKAAELMGDYVRKQQPQVSSILGEIFDYGKANEGGDSARDWLRKASVPHVQILS